MCGLVGIAGDTTSNWKNVFTDLLIVDSLRGNHSTGVAAVRRFQNEINLAKQVGGPHNLINTKEYGDVLSPPLKAIIGHNRHATLGEHTIENAHPFKFENVVGAHNGTLDKWAIRKLHNHEKFGTDSEAIFATINEFGIQKTVENLAGAWALTWFDVKSNTINMLRNSRRPLFYTYSKDRTSLIWASEAEFLELVMDRAHNENEGTIYSVDVDCHLKWRIPEFINGKFDAPTKTEMKPVPLATSSQTSYHYTGGWQDDLEEWMGGGRNNVVPFVPSASGQTKSGTTSYSLVFPPIKKDTSRFRPPYKFPDGKIINKKLFNVIVADGCVMCGANDAVWGDFIKPLKDVDGHHCFVCEECYNNDETFEICRQLI